MLFIKLMLLSLALVGISFLFFGVRIFFTKNGYFSASSVGDSREMRKRKIYCPNIMQKIEDKKAEKELKATSCGDCPVKESC